MPQENHNSNTDNRRDKKFDNELLLNELRKSEANHRLIFQKSALAQLICTQNSLHIVKVNEAALDLYGYDEHEFLRLDIRQLRLPADRASLNATR